MTHVIKRTLYVGLGGTGMQALLNTKKMFVDTYGEVPPMVGFLGIDTDRGQYDKYLLSKKSPTGRVVLEAHEQLPILVDDPMDIYSYEAENLDWIPDQNVQYLTSMTLGAGQVRTNGRFALTVNYHDICNKVKSVLGTIGSAAHDDNPLWKASAGKDIEIALVFSICGGTGCGTFINMAYLLREIAPKCKITGYAMMPNTFSWLNHGNARIEPNAYGAIRDLDYLMSMTGAPSSHSVSFKTLDNENSYNFRPFDAVFFIDNQTATGTTYPGESGYKKLLEMISLALVTSSGALAKESASISDNVSKEIAEGRFNVDDKIAWASGMGACEIKVNHETLENVYSLKAAKYLIDLLRSSDADAEVKARAWIDSARIRENENNDQLIDRLMPDHVADGILEVEPKSPQTMVDAYITSQKVDRAALDEISESLLKEAKASFETFLDKTLATDGVNAARNVITEVNSQLNIFLKEMREEHEDFSNKAVIYKSSYEAAIDDLINYMSRIIKTRQGIQDRCDSVASDVKNYITSLKEDARRTTAISFFSQLMVYLNDWDTSLSNLHNNLSAVYKILSKQIADKENSCEENKSSTSFSIDLTYKCITKIELDKEQITVSNFSKFIENQMLSLTKDDLDKLQARLLNYAMSLSSTQEFSAFTIDEVFREMSEEEFNNLINKAITKSSPLFRYNYKGRKPLAKGVTRPNDLFFIGVPDMNNSRLNSLNSNNRPFFESQLSGGGQVQFASIGLTDRVIVFRQIGVVPAYAVCDILDYERDYKDEKQIGCHCSIDKMVDAIMEQTKFKIMPEKITSHREQDQLGLWIYACVFGKIKNEKGKYKLQCSKGTYIDEQWYYLGTYRNIAFDKFREIYDDIKEELENYFSDEIARRGKDDVAVLLEDVKRNYRDGYSHMDLDDKTLKSPAYQLVFELFNRELEYVSKQLVF